ncbi:MAG: hypothetical protein ABJG78_01710 [Cyclobacteriaceae bacterium]
MRQVISYVLLFSIVAHLLWSSVYMLDYYVNSDFYKEHCQNKSRPELKCDGKCILAQKLKMNTENDEAVPFIPINHEYLASVTSVSLNPAYVYVEHKSGWVNNYLNPFDFHLLKPPI